MPAQAETSDRGIHYKGLPNYSVITVQWARAAPKRRTAGTLLHFHPGLPREHRECIGYPWWSLRLGGRNDSNIGKP